MLRRIKRDYRKLAPGKFFSFNQNVKHCLIGNPNFPEAVWGAHLAVLQQYFEKMDRHFLVFRLAANGDRLQIRERDKLTEEIVVLLDEIASVLEALSVRNPDALFTTGFSVTQERRSHNRTKLPLTAPPDFSVVNTGERGKAIGSATTMPGVFNSEIHINRKDPSVEEDWFHKLIDPDASNMVMENLEAGNTFFRMRFHGPDGHGPWSAITSVTIT
ncbi:MAG TPA: hypothetical protein DCZ75_11965 [Geobacter sp.]|nr:hypothetical protein [Geobacter sp.]